MFIDLANSNWQDVAIAYVPVFLALGGFYNATRRHLKRQDDRAAKVKKDLDDYNGTTLDELKEIKKEVTKK